MGLRQRLAPKHNIQELAEILDGQVDTVKVGVVYHNALPVKQYAAPEGWSISAGYTEPAVPLGKTEGETRQQLWEKETNVDDSELDRWTEYLESGGFEVKRRDISKEELGLFERIRL